MKRKYISPTIQVYYLSTQSKLLTGSDDIMFRDPTDPVDDPEDVI